MCISQDVSSSSTHEAIVSDSGIVCRRRLLQPFFPVTYKVQVKANYKLQGKSLFNQGMNVYGICCYLDLYNVAVNIICYESGLLRHFFMDLHWHSCRHHWNLLHKRRKPLLYHLWPVLYVHQNLCSCSSGHGLC